MAKAGREIVALVCKACKSQNYITSRNKVNLEAKSESGSKLELKKFCKKCKIKTLHKERVKLK